MMLRSTIHFGGGAEKTSDMPNPPIRGMRIICDCCGANMSIPTAAAFQKRGRLCIVSAPHGWLVTNRGDWHEAHYCPKCSPACTLEECRREASQ